jgi:3-methyl-2-oxobutanoate hydroxymethyltransferase
MVTHGMKTTVGVPIDLMVMQGQAVLRRARKAVVVVDMPFGSYQDITSDITNVDCGDAGHVMEEAGCEASKLEAELSAQSVL